MIKNFLHKGLGDFYTSGNTRGVNNNHIRRLKFILARLEAILNPEDMNLPGFYFHKLSGKKNTSYSVRVNKNWRVVFKFDGQDVYDVDYYIDYH